MPMRDEDKAILRRHSFQLVQNVEVKEIFVNALLSHGVITDDHRDRILAKTTNSERVNEVLTVLPRRPQTAFEGFCKALKDSGQADIVNSYLKAPKIEHRNDDDDDELSDEDREDKFKDVLTTHRARFMDMISVDNRLFAHLNDLHVITPSVQKKITLNATDDVQVERLLDYLSKRPIEDLDNFLVALRKDKQKHVSDFINKKL